MASNGKANEDRHKGRSVHLRIARATFARLAAEAKAQRRTIGSQLTLIVEAYFAGQKPQSSTLPPAEG